MTMFITVSEYLKRITLTLEQVVAPKVESEFERGQLLAAVFLLDQLADKVDYKDELIDQEIKLCCATIKEIAGVFQQYGLDIPDDLKSFLEKLDQEGAGKGLEFRGHCNRMLSAAIQSFFTHKDKLDPAVVHKIDGIILGQFKTIGLRDMGMLKVSTSGRLIQSKEKK